MYCHFKGKRNHQSKANIIQYKDVHDKYYNLFCSLPENSIYQRYIYISNHYINLYNSDNAHQFNLLFCLTTLFSYNNTKRFTEFIEYYRYFGVDKFIIYNTNCSKDIERIFIYYKKLGIMDIIYDNFTHNLYEKKRFHLWKHNDCFHRYKYSAKRIIFTDHDEIIYSSIYNDSVSLFSHLNNNAASYYFYPKLTITNGRGFFISGNYSICPKKYWKYIINKPNCIKHLSIHYVITKTNCFVEKIPYNVAYVIHARNEASYHAKECKIWKYEEFNSFQKNVLLGKNYLIKRTMNAK